jgi:hypothetical protein
MHLVLTLLLTASAAFADRIVVIPHEADVLNAPAVDSSVLLRVKAGERVAVAKDRTGGFYRVRLKQEGVVLTGYMAPIDLGLADLSPRPWGFGGGAVYSALFQKGKNFTTDDSVQYTTTEYKSTSVSPFLTLQVHDDDFWRLTLAYKKAHFRTTASTDVIGSSAQPVTLDETFLSALLQGGWTPFKQHAFYLGGGAEVAKAIAIDLKMGGSNLTTTAQDEPIYLGLQAFLGGQWFFGPVSVFVEARYEGILNQAPIIYDLEAAGGILFWL